MDVYLYTNIIISTVALLTLHFGKGSNNANYYLSLFAIVAWFIPFNLLVKLVPEQVLATPIIVSLSQATTTTSSTIQLVNTIELNTWITWVFFSLVAAGMLLFIARIIQSSNWQRKLLTDSQLTPLTQYSWKYQVPIYSSKQVESGLLVGIFKPAILINSKICNPQLVNLIITHEVQHLRAHDNFRLMLLALSTSLFWWNPLVRKLVSINRFYIEARCDEQASKNYGKENYLSDLSALILNHHNSHTESKHFLASSALTKGKNNLTRIKLLKGNRKMTIRNKLSYLLATFVTLMTISWGALSTIAIKNDEIESDELGALVTFEISVSQKLENVENIHSTRVVYWLDFNEKASFGMSDNFSFNFIVKESQKFAFIEIDLIEIIEDKKTIIEQPKLALTYGQEGMIEINNPNVSENSYAIKVLIDKTKQPED